MGERQAREGQIATEYQAVDSIQGPGEYRIEVSGEYLPFFDSLIPQRLRTLYPGLSAVRFYIASLEGNEYAPASLRVEEKWDGYDSNLAGVIINGEIYRMNGSGNSSNGHGYNHFSIEDIGDMQIVKNRFTYDKPKGRDGSIKIIATGGVGHIHRDSPADWKADVVVTGERPGSLVQQTIDMLNKWGARREGRDPEFGYLRVAISKKQQVEG